MNVDRLVTMANDIAAFFAAEPDHAAAAGMVASHLTRFWEPRMRRQIVEHYRAAGTGLTDVAAAGVAQLSRSSTG
jgi:formate dehydrogenase subunit delta